MTKILVVDDQEQGRYLLDVLLRGHGYAVALAEDGASALASGRRSPPALVISDILMPGMDGFALCRAWVKDDLLRDIPFIFYTATYTEAQDEQLALSLGAARFLIKPLEVEPFLATIETVLRDWAGGRLAKPETPPLDEAVFLKTYNEALIRKLEDKVQQLAAVNQALAADVARRIEAEAALQESHAQLENLSRRLVNAQETERRELAYELHDEVGQVITAVRTNLEILRLRQEPEVLQRRLGETIEIVDRALQHVRSMASNLHPALLDDFGLAATLSWYLQRLAADTGLQVSFQRERGETRLAPAIEAAAFRVVQEGLTNVVRHAHAKQVVVDVRLGPAAGGEGVRELELVVRDDGVGFDVDKAMEQARRGRSLGLAVMRERVLLLGGRIMIKSAAGQGTEIRVQLPVTVDGEEFVNPGDRATSAFVH